MYLKKYREELERWFSCSSGGLWHNSHHSSSDLQSSVTEEFDILFWPILVLHPCGTHIYMEAKIHILENILNFENKKNTNKLYDAHQSFGKTKQHNIPK